MCCKMVRSVGCFRRVLLVELIIIISDCVHCNVIYAIIYSAWTREEQISGLAVDLFLSRTPNRVPGYVDAALEDTFSGSV